MAAEVQWAFAQLKQVAQQHLRPRAGQITQIDQESGLAHLIDRHPTGLDEQSGNGRRCGEQSAALLLVNQGGLTPASGWLAGKDGNRLLVARRRSRG